MMAVMYIAMSSATSSLVHQLTCLEPCRIPVYILNALYLAPLTLWTYLNYGRPGKPSKFGGSPQSHCIQHSQDGTGGMPREPSEPEEEMKVESSADNTVVAQCNANYETQTNHYPPEEEESGQNALGPHRHGEWNVSQDHAALDSQAV